MKFIPTEGFIHIKKPLSKADELKSILNIEDDSGYELGNLDVDPHAIVVCQTSFFLKDKLFKKDALLVVERQGIEMIRFSDQEFYFVHQRHFVGHLEE